MWNAASRCIVRRAFLALFALGAFAVTLQAPAGDAASKKVTSSTSSVTVTQATETSLSLSWQRVRRAAGYDLYLDQTRVATTQTTAYTLAGLRCGATYQLGVDSFNARGVRSSIVNLAGSTRACPVAPAGGDASPPTSPATLSQGATTATSISLLWSASLDNVGVAGYDLFLNGSKVGTTTATSYSFANLSCGTSYTLAVDAFDAAGNRSQQAAIQASTGPCPSQAPPTSALSPTQFNRITYQYGSVYTIAQEANRYALMDMQSTDASTAQQLKAANPNLKIVVYQDSRVARSGDPSGLTTCVPYDVAVNHPDWFLHDQNGNIISQPGNNGAVYPLDIGNTAVQQECASHAIATAKSGGFDGVFYDEIDAKLVWTLPSGITSAKYPTDSSWQAATTAELAYLQPVVKNASLLAIGNLGGTTSAPGLWQTWNSYLDGALEESWTDGGLGTAQQIGDWPAKLSQAAWSEANHKIFVAHSYNTTEAGNTYGLASMMLVANGESSYSVSPSYNQSGSTSSSEVWFPEYGTAQQLGAPSGPFTKLSNGVYERVFANGIVLVNPSSITVSSFSLGGAIYSGSGLSNVTAVSMAPTSGLVLLKQ
jgi:chitodextrinase